MTDITKGQNASELSREKIVEALKTVYDPEIPCDIYELGLIYDIKIDESKNVYVAMTLTSPNCPEAQSLPLTAKNRVKSLSGSNEVEVEIVWDPPWNPEMMSEVAKLEIGYF